MLAGQAAARRPAASYPPPDTSAWPSSARVAASSGGVLGIQGEGWLDPLRAIHEEGDWGTASPRRAGGTTPA